VRKGKNRHEEENNRGKKQIRKEEGKKVENKCKHRKNEEKNQTNKK
jgi:hypothetical protein